MMAPSAVANEPTTLGSVSTPRTTAQPPSPRRARANTKPMTDQTRVTAMILEVVEDKSRGGRAGTAGTAGTLGPALRRQRRGRAFEIPAVDDPLHEEAGLLTGTERLKLGVSEWPVEDAVVATA
jgi:L-serine deaminase